MHRSPYDAFMLHFHDWLFTDVVPHAVTGGRLAFEQTVIVARRSLANPENAPAAILEKLAGKVLTV